MPWNSSLARYIDPLHAMCRQAGAAIIAHYHSAQAGEHEYKSDATPLTAADLIAQDILLQGLQAFTLPVLSEESDEAAVAMRRDWSRFWLVDPLDGTKEFIARTGEFTINIALVDQHRPILGFLFLPLQEHAYLGIPGQGAWKHSGEAWQPIHCRTLDSADTTVVLTSRRHKGAQLDAFLARAASELGRVRREYVGSALKFCYLAEGRADFYPRYSPCSEWDTAAGQALVEAAGGKVIDLHGRPLAYNRGPGLINPHFVAMADPGQHFFLPHPD